MGSYRWLALAAALGCVAIGVVAYDAGLTRGAAEAAAASGTLPPYAFGWGWYRPWGFGFGFPLFFFLFWLVLARAAFWGGPWRRRWYYHGGDVPPAFDDWHRRAHERMQPDSDRRQ
jgi:hypothetical protein